MVEIEWSDKELTAAVVAYVKMARKEVEKKPYVKKKVYMELAEHFDRTTSSFEFRMQNISAILEERGEPWIIGLRPAKNIGVNVKPRLMKIIDRLWKSNSNPVIFSAEYKKKLPAMRSWLISLAKSEGVATYQDVMDVFGIDRFSLRHAMDYLGHQADNLDEPILTALIVGKKTGVCSVGLYKEFDVDNDADERRRLYKFWNITEKYNIIEENFQSGDEIEVNAARFASVEIRPKQAKFRREVYAACEGKCVVSGCDIMETLDAAHKTGRSWKLGHNSAADGYLLRKDLHGLYDKKLLRINEKNIVELDDRLVDHYGMFSGIMIK